MQKIRKAVIPAAGLGTRVLPATKAMPKEMLPIVDKPAIQYIVEEAVAAGIEEILTVYSSIVCGFARPMRKEHVRFLQHCLLPLHRLDRLVDFSSSLTRCLLLYIAQDGNLAPLVGLDAMADEQIIRGILHYWPRSNTQNELLLIDEIEKIVQTMDGEQMASVICPLLTRLRKCLLSQQFLVLASLGIHR